MEIVDYETFLIRPGTKGQVILRLETDEGIIGIGEGTSQTKARAVAATIEQLSTYFLGEDPFNHERLFQAMYRHEWFSDNVINLTAIAAIDTALWDIKARALDVPLYQLLGGCMNDTNSVKAYVTGRLPKNDDVDAIAEAAKEVVADGIRAMKFDPFGDAWLRLSPAELDLALQKVRAIHETVGNDVELLLEGHGRFTPGTAVQVTRRMEEFYPMWFEEPTLPDNLDALKKVTKKSPIPIAAGEHEHTKYGHQELLTQTDVDVIQPDLVNAGGPTEAKKIAALAESQHVSIAPHNSNGVIGTAMTLHVDISTPNFMVQEVTSIDPGWHTIVDNPVEIVDGYFQIPDGPGLGLELDIDAVREFEVSDGELMEPKLSRWDLEHN